MGLFSFFKKSPADKSAGTIQVKLVVTAQLNHKLMPMDRGERYEDSLADELQKLGYGETDGGGTMMSKSKEIEFIDVEMVLFQPEKSIPFVIDRLESYGAPKGSKLIIREGDTNREIPFGKIEGIGIYLDGVNLPDEVYKNCDVNVVIEELNKRVTGHGNFQSHWQGQTETGLYFYGDDAEMMKKLIADYMESYPLCKGARIVPSHQSRSSFKQSPPDTSAAHPETPDHIAS